MNNSDKELSKNAGIATLDAAAAGIDVTLGAPLMTGAWNLTKALLGKGIAIRQKKALEFFEMISEHPQVFTKILLQGEEFQDAFVIAFEAYIKERDAAKRLLLRNIFIDFALHGTPTSYPLERYYEIARQITFYEAELLNKLIKMRDSLEDKNTSMMVSDSDVEPAFHLLSLGLLVLDTSARFASREPGIPPVFVSVSSLGVKFKKFIIDTDNFAFDK